MADLGFNIKLRDLLTITVYFDFRGTKDSLNFKFFNSGWVLEGTWNKYNDLNIVVHGAANKLHNNETVLLVRSACMLGLAETSSSSIMKLTLRYKVPH